MMPPRSIPLKFYQFEILRMDNPNKTMGTISRNIILHASKVKLEFSRDRFSLWGAKLYSSFPLDIKEITDGFASKVKSL